MEILIGVILYLLVIGAFSAFGKFLKECDEDIPRTPEKKEQL